MTKFDLWMIDSVTGSKSNLFLTEFWANGIRPYLVATPTSQRASDNIEATEQYLERTKLLNGAVDFERTKLDDWLKTMESNYLEAERKETFLPIYAEKIGFPKAVKGMNAILFEDAKQRLPEVIKEIENIRQMTQNQLRKLHESRRYGDPEVVKSVTMEVVEVIDKKVREYMEGSMDVARTLRHRHKTLEEELDEEEVGPSSK